MKYCSDRKNEFSIRNSSLISKVESRKLAGGLNSYFVLFGSHQAPLVRTAEEFQTERNSCPVLRSVFGFQIY